MSKGQLGVNKLDEACRSHDSVYTKSEDTTLRNEADLKLEMDAWERVKAKDSSYTEKIVAWMVTNVMKMKRKWNTRSTREIRKTSYLFIFFLLTTTETTFNNIDKLIKDRSQDAMRTSHSYT